MERSVENMVTLSGLPFNSTTTSFHILLFENWIYTLQNNVICWVSLFCNRFRLGPMAQATLVQVKEDNICQNMWDGSEVLLGMCWGTCRKLVKLNGSSLGTWGEHIGSKGENEKIFWHHPQLKRKIVGALKCMIRLLIGCMYSLFWKLLVTFFWHRLLAFLRAWLWFNIYY